jgi:hypothetical protein
MKLAEIKPEGTYKAKVTYGCAAKAKVLEVGVEFKRSSHARKNNKGGVRVVTLADAGRPGAYSFVEAGTEFTIRSRDVLHEWTDEDEAKARERAEADARAAGFIEELSALGFDAGRYGKDVMVDARHVSFTHDAFERFKVAKVMEGVRGNS